MGLYNYLTLIVSKVNAEERVDSSSHMHSVTLLWTTRLSKNSTLDAVSYWLNIDMAVSLFSPVSMNTTFSSLCEVVLEI